MLDIVIKNGALVNFQDGNFEELNLGIKDGKIAALTKEVIKGRQEIDADKMIVAPGFIDIHMHEDPIVTEGNKRIVAEEITKLSAAMGVTTAIGGCCGTGMGDVAEYYKIIDNDGLSVNMGLYTGYSSLRQKIGIEDRYAPAKKDEIEKLKNLIRTDLAAGAIGLSFGIEYTPGSTTNEIIEVGKVVREFPGRSISVHCRHDAGMGIEAIKEAIYLGWVTAVPVQISHLGSCTAFGMMEESLTIIEKAKQAGIDLMSDCYPYNAFSTSIGSAVFDEGCFERYKATFSNLLVLEGKYKGCHCTKDSFHYLREYEPETKVSAFMMDDEEVAKAILHPDVLICSDGLFRNNQGHPRGAGAFPRYLSHYVREKGMIPLLEALSKITIKPALRLGLRNKGQLDIGKDADIVIFNADEIKDTSTYQQPAAPPLGIDYVLVNGVLAVDRGRLTGNKPGRAIRLSDS